MRRCLWLLPYLAAAWSAGCANPTGSLSAGRLPYPAAKSAATTAARDPFRQGGAFAEASPRGAARPPAPTAYAARGAAPAAGDPSVGNLPSATADHFGPAAFQTASAAPASADPFAGVRTEGAAAASVGDNPFAAAPVGKVLPAGYATTAAKPATASADGWAGDAPADSDGFLPPRQ